MTQAVVLVLAAGRGARFTGRTHKLLAPWGAGTVLQSTLASVEASGLPWRVVLSAALRLQVIAEGIALPRSRLVEAPAVPVGMGHSIAAGVAAAPDASGWLVLPADLPAVRASTLQAVAAALRTTPDMAAVPVWTTPVGKRLSGHPVGFPSSARAALLGLVGDSGARQVLASLQSADVAVDDPGIVTDIDTVEDWERSRPADNAVLADAPSEASRVPDRGSARDRAAVATN